jgi:hypothetical protein
MKNYHWHSEHYADIPVPSHRPPSNEGEDPPSEETDNLKDADLIQVPGDDSPEEQDDAHGPVPSHHITTAETLRT